MEKVVVHALVFLGVILLPSTWAFDISRKEVNMIVGPPPPPPAPSQREDNTRKEKESLFPYFGDWDDDEEDGYPYSGSFPDYYLHRPLTPSPHSSSDHHHGHPPHHSNGRRPSKNRHHHGHRDGDEDRHRHPSHKCGDHHRHHVSPRGDPVFYCFVPLPLDGRHHFRLHPSPKRGSRRLRPEFLYRIPKR